MAQPLAFMPMLRIGDTGGGTTVDESVRLLIGSARGDQGRYHQGCSAPKDCNLDEHRWRLRRGARLHPRAFGNDAIGGLFQAQRAVTAEQDGWQIGY
jgi:hypothetical protein